jgi:hypothetical protein
MVKNTDSTITIELNKSVSPEEMALDLKTSVAEVIRNLDFEPLEDWTPLDLKIRFCIHLAYIFVDEHITQKKEEQFQKKKDFSSRVNKNTYLSGKVFS